MDRLAKRLQQQQFRSDSQRAILNLMVAANFLERKFDEACAPFGITGPQYNVLRILRGAYPRGYSRNEITSRMIAPTSDVTRLLDRLEKSGWIERVVGSEDKRMSIARITAKGKLLVEKVAPALAEFNDLLSGRFSQQELAQLSALCERIY